MSDPANVIAPSLAPGVEFDDPRQCWRVTGSRLDLFAVPVNAAGEQVETGRYLFTMEPDQVGFGVVPRPLANGTWLAIRARGASSTPVATLLRDAFDADRPAANNIVEAVDGWLVQLAGCLGGNEVADMVAEPNRDSQQAAAGARIGVRRGTLLWLDPQRGALLFLGRAGATSLPGDPPIPVPSGYWALAPEPTTFSAWTTAALTDDRPSRGRFWQALERTNDRLLSLIADDFLRQRATEKARIADKLRESASAFANGLRRIGAVLRRDDRLSELDTPGDPLFAAASLVAARQKIVLKRVPNATLADPGEYLETICRAAFINMRQVKLERDWFRKDNGPLLGFASGAGGTARPLALLPLATTGYEALDPERDERVVIGAREAQSLLPTAYTFYRSFETAPLTGRGLLRFGFEGMGRDLTRVLGMGLLGGLLSLALPLISDPLFSDILPHADTNSLAAVVLALAMAALGSSGFELVRSFSLVRVTGRMEAGIQAAVWDRLLRLSPGFFRNYTTGDLADRVMNVTVIRSVITSAISSSILDALFSLISFALMFWYSWRLALVATGLAVVAVLLTVGLTALQIPHQRALMRDMGRIGGLTYQLLTAIGKLRVAGAEGRAFGRWTAILAQQKEYAYRARRIAAAQQTLAQVFPPVTSIALYIAMIKLGTPVAGGQPATDSETMVPLLTLGAYLAFNAAFGQFVSALMSVVSGLTSLIMIVPLYERLRPVLSNVPETPDNAQTPGVLAGNIEFRRLTFRYLDSMPLVLNDVSFEVRPGDYVALVGPSGGGKSTIVRLLLGFETPQSGGVFFDHKDVATLDLGELRRQIGVVLQSAGLLAGSLYENIVGSQPIPMNEAWEAARMAGLDADIRAMPMGMHTLLSDSASMLSGGQRQRLIIARALVRKPRILIFDEATSALDNRTQAIVNETLAQLNLTRIVIAHRLSTVRSVDRILVLKQGRIVETGRYDELLARNGAFSELVKQQLL
jgi:NHLM bacteriocin system ABC transporter ATP-binding protein